MDSFLMRSTGKVSLSGQFSTILRPLYLNEWIDSTVSPGYFKRCVDKPGAITKKALLSSKKTFPFRHVFGCAQKMNFKDTNKLSLKNWFSFVLSRKEIPQKPECDYYFDFDFSDAYTFSIDFNRPVEIKNKEAFTSKINNEYFELESGIFKNQSTYLLSVKVAVKQSYIPLEKANLLMDLLEQLDELNNFTLDLVKK